MNALPPPPPPQWTPPPPERPLSPRRQPLPPIRPSRQSSIVPLLVVFGMAAIVSAAGWYFSSRPSDRELRTAAVSCAVRGDTTCDLPEATIAGPIVVAVVGAFMILIGVILYVGRRP